jgi:signal transduction histidine kinase
MKKGLIAILIVALAAVGATAAFAFGPGYGMGMGAGYGTCPLAGGTVTTVQSQKLAKFFLIAVILISSVGLFHYEGQKNEIKKDKQAELLAIADLKAGQIINWRKERLADAATIRANFLQAPQLQRLVRRLNGTRERRDILARLESFKETNQYDDILFLDKNGIILLSMTHESQVVGPDEKKLASEALRTRKIFFSDLYQSKMADNIRLSIVVPMLSEDKNDILGVFLLRIDPHLFLYPLIEKWPTRSPTAETLLIRREGEDVLYLNDLRHRNGTALAFRLPISRQQLPAAMALRGKEGIFEGIDYRGTEVLVALRTIPDSSWAIVAKVDKEEVYAPIRGRLWNAMLIIGLCILLSGEGVLLVWRKREGEEQRKYRERLEDTVEQRTEELERTHNQLQESYNDLESFSYSVSHDLRQPLMIVEWFSRNLLKKSGNKLDADERQNLSVINEQARKLTQFVKDLLSFSRASTKEIQKSDIDMNALWNSVTEEMKIMIGERSVQIDTKDLPVAWGDESLIRQAIVNLLSNALKYTGPRDIAKIEIGSAEKEKENIYYVKDNGVGFDSEYADKLFSLFERLHSSEEFEGTGIGLVIAKRIVNKHGGRIWAEGTVNEGATFYFSLPKKEIPINI